MRLKWIGLAAVLALLALAAFTYRTREANPYCQNKVRVAPSGPSCHKYKYWWDH
jgi:hypothetical protein